MQFQMTGRESTKAVLHALFLGEARRRMVGLAGTLLLSLLPALTIGVQVAGAQAPPPNQLMVLSADHTHLINTITGKPVFMTGDAAWSLIAQLSNADADKYLSSRAAEGFNIIVVNLIEHLFANNAPADFYGDLPFTGAPFATPNEPYFAHADQVISRAAHYGITVLLDSSYVGFACGGQGWAAEMEAASDATMTAWGAYVGNRYKSFDNVIHLIGGDADPRNCSPSLAGKLQDVAGGIKSVDSVHLMTAHNVRGESAMDVWAGAPWLNLNDIYNAPYDIPSKANAEYQRAKALPFFLVEDYYENENSETELGVREEGYWAVLSGAYLGRFFGNNPIWCFNETKSGDCLNGLTWQGALFSTGSMGQAFLGALFRSREHWMLIPDINHQVVTAGYGSMPTLTVTARTRDGQTIISYIPTGNATTLTVNLTAIISATGKANCWWFNPRAGTAKLIGTFANKGLGKVTPPDSNDWVLVIDDANAKLPAPGSANL